MYHWILLATWWRKDGTPVPDRRLISHLQDGDPLAILYVVAALLIVVAPAIRRMLRNG
jgi:hypothetical protein